jgi:hypothetical protein
MTPVEAARKKNEDLVQCAFMQKYKNILTVSPTFKVGDVVRIYEFKYLFDKGYRPRWTDELFVVDVVHESKPIT